jgi:hypothetical protein
MEGSNADSGTDVKRQKKRDALDQKLKESGKPAMK